MRIMFLSDYLPYPLIGGDRIRVYNLMRRAAEEHEVWFAGFADAADKAEGVSRLQSFCSRVEVVDLPRRPRLARMPRKLAYTLTGVPPSYEFVYSRELMEKVKQMTLTPDLDIVEIQHTRMVIYLNQIPSGGRLKRVLALHNVDQYDRIMKSQQSPSRRLRTWLHSQLLRRWEHRQAERFDRCITVSDIDRDLLLKSNPRLQVDVVPNGVDCETYQPLPDALGHRALLLVGNMGYQPNADGAVWACREILPRVRSLVGDVELWIVGISPMPEVIELDGNGVHVTGRVDEVVPYYEKAAVSIVPLRGGSGTRLKILEAMALGRPVVSTSVGCEGLDVVEGRHLLIADDPESFAQKTARLLTDRALYQHIVSEARRLVETKYDWGAIAQQLLRVYHDVKEPRGAGEGGRA